MQNSNLSGYRLLDVLTAEVARHYSNETHEAFFAVMGDFPDYDIVSASQKIRIELKCETTPMRTGNACIEYWNADYDAPSGVLSTKANLWIHILPEGDSLLAIEFDVDKLRKLVIETGELKTNGGRNALCKLIPVDVFKANARRCFVFRTRFFAELMVSTGAVVDRGAA